MIKGCQKRIIHITDPKSPYFEEAYFVLKRGGGQRDVSGDDMVKEAMRIADEAVRSAKVRKEAARKNRAVAASVGVAAVSFLFGMIMLFYTIA